MMEVHSNFSNPIPDINQGARDDIEGMPGFSTSVNRAIENLKSYELVSSWHIVREICLIHPEYGKGVAKVIAAESSPVGIRATSSINEWINNIYNELKSDFSNTNVIDGRMVILALARIDKILEDYLTKPRSANTSESNTARKVTIQIPKEIHEKISKKNLHKKK